MRRYIKDDKDKKIITIELDGDKLLYSTDNIDAADLLFVIDILSNMADEIISKN